MHSLYCTQKSSHSLCRPSPFKNFSEYHELKQLSYFCFKSLHSGAKDVDIRFPIISPCSLHRPASLLSGPLLSCICSIPPAIGSSLGLPSPTLPALCFFSGQFWADRPKPFFAPPSAPPQDCVWRSHLRHGLCRKRDASHFSRLPPQGQLKKENTLLMLSANMNVGPLNCETVFPLLSWAALVQTTVSESRLARVMTVQRWAVRVLCIAW